MTVNEAIRAVRDECRNVQAKAYAAAAMEASVMYGTEGLVEQVQYILANVQGWRGETAREAKKVLRDFLKKGGQDEDSR